MHFVTSGGVYRGRWQYQSNRRASQCAHNLIIIIIIITIIIIIIITIIAMTIMTLARSSSSGGVCSG
jgi:heme/copper-type cytochrome/quinol oxidase subunit 2